MTKQKKSLALAKSLRLEIGTDGHIYGSISSSQGSFYISKEVLSFLCAIGNEKRSDLPEIHDQENLLQDLISAGFVVDLKSDNVKKKGPDDGFADPWIQWAMISDDVRCHAYDNAIRSYFKKNPAHTALDVGAGCGFLTAICLDSGSSKVTSIEETKIAQHIPAILKKSISSFKKEKFILENKNSFDAKVDPNTNLIVSELFGNDPFSEGVISTLKDIGKRFKSRQPTYIPKKLEVFFEIAQINGHPVQHRIEHLQKSSETQKSNFYEKFLTVSKETLDLKNVSFPIAFKKQDFTRITKPILMGSCFLNPPKEDIKKDFQKKCEVKLGSISDSNATQVGLLWFRVFLNDTVSISSHPLEKDACHHWSPIAMPFQQKLGQGQIIELKSALNDFENFLEFSLTSNGKLIAKR